MVLSLPRMYGVHISRKCIEYMHFYSCPSSLLKTTGKIFWKFIAPRTKGAEKTMICFIKSQLKNLKMTWKIRLFIFCMIYNFSKCDGFTILWIISVKQCGIKFIASSLQPWRFDTKITSEKIRFKAGSLPRMINKEWLAQFIYKPT